MSYSQVTDVNETGVEIVYLRAAAARTKGDLVRIGTGHADGVNVDIALADDTSVWMSAVALKNIASGTIGPYARRGTVDVTVPSGTYTAGNGIDVLDGAVRDSTAAAEAPAGTSTLNDLGCIRIGGTTVTTITVYLYGQPTTAQT